MLYPEKELFEAPRGRRTVWFSAENPQGLPGQGGKAHLGYKGAPSYQLRPGETVSLAETDGPGVIREIWLAGFDNGNQVGGVADDLLLECFWDGCPEPAVRADVDGFFCQACAPYKAPFQNALFGQPNVGDQSAGNVGNCFIPMPFHSHAKITLTNRSRDTTHEMFYCVEATVDDELKGDELYFHCVQQRGVKTAMGRDFEILPRVEGSGRYLGANIWVRGGKNYAGSWFGEGEVKIYLDGDGAHPSLVGTGTEDYILTACGMVPFSMPYAGCTAMVTEDEGTDDERTVACFYRLHLPDPIWFHSACRVTLQQMGGGTKEQIARARELGAAIKPIVAVRPEKESGVRGDLNKTYVDAQDPVDVETGDIFWINYLREDEMSSTTYFYLDRP